MWPTSLPHLITLGITVLYSKKGRKKINQIWWKIRIRQRDGKKKNSCKWERYSRGNDMAPHVKFSSTFQVLWFFTV